MKTSSPSPIKKLTPSAPPGRRHSASRRGKLTNQRLGETRRRTGAGRRCLRLRRRREAERAAPSPTAQTTPPLAVPSSLVTTRPVRPSASSKALTCASAFCRCWRRARGALREARRLRFRGDALHLANLLHGGATCVGSRPAVSAMTTSVPRARAAPSASNTTAPGSPDCWPITARRCARPRPPAARAPPRGNVSPAASSTLRPCNCKPVRKLADRGRLARAVNAGTMMTKGPPRNLQFLSSGNSNSTARPSARVARPRVFELFPSREETIAASQPRRSPACSSAASSSS